MPATLSMTRSETTTESFPACERLWFEDGDVIVLAGDPDTSSSCASFLLDIGVLSGASPVLARLIDDYVSDSDFDDFDDEVTVVDDGPAVLRLGDHPVDLQHLFLAIYNGLNADEKSPTYFAELSAVLRLSRKYAMSALFDDVLALLVADFPASIAEWDARELKRNHIGKDIPSTRRVHPTLVINLVRELQLDYNDFPGAAILRAAFYDLSRYRPSDIAGGAPAPHGAASNARVRLAAADLLRALRMKESGGAALDDFVRSVHEARSCTRAGECALGGALRVELALHGLACVDGVVKWDDTSRAHLGMGDPLALLAQTARAHALAAVPCDEDGESMCECCREAFVAQTKAYREQLWEEEMWEWMRV